MNVQAKKEQLRKQKDKESKDKRQKERKTRKDKNKRDQIDLTDDDNVKQEPIPMGQSINFNDHSSKHDKPKHGRKRKRDDDSDGDDYDGGENDINMDNEAGDDFSLLDEPAHKKRRLVQQVCFVFFIHVCVAHIFTCFFLFVYVLYRNQNQQIIMKMMAMNHLVLKMTMMIIWEIMMKMMAMLELWIH